MEMLYKDARSLLYLNLQGKYNILGSLVASDKLANRRVVGIDQAMKRARMVQPSLSA